MAESIDRMQQPLNKPESGGIPQSTDNAMDVDKQPAGNSEATTTTNDPRYGWRDGNSTEHQEEPNQHPPELSKRQRKNQGRIERRKRIAEERAASLAQSNSNPSGFNHREARANPKPPSVPKKKSKPNTNKRGRDSETTPTTSGNAKRKDVKATPVDNPNTARYSSVLVEAVLNMAVVQLDGNKKIIPMTKEVYKMIFSGINQIMFDTLLDSSDPTNEFAPVFERMQIKRNVIQIICKCRQTTEWLKNMEQRLSSQIKLNLIVCPFDEVPWPKRYFAYFPYTNEENGRLLRMVNLCNANLPNIDWEVIRRKVTDSGIQLLVSVDDVTANVLDGERGLLHFGAGKAIFRRFTAVSKKDSNVAESLDIVEATDTDLDCKSEDLARMADMSLAGEGEKKPVSQTLGAAESLTSTSVTNATDKDEAPKVIYTIIPNKNREITDKIAKSSSGGNPDDTASED